MLKKSILPKMDLRKIIRKIIILNIVTYICIGTVLPNFICATQTKYSYTNGKLSAYPGFEELLSNLKKKHPNWSFTILETELDWNEVIKNETVASHARNLIYYTYNGGWVCSSCGNRTYDSGKWKCASETAVAYYMDPRNWLNENNIFQFEDLSYKPDIQTLDGVNKILSNVGWAKGEKVKYKKTDGTEATLDKSYAQIIMEAAKEAEISPYHLAARIKQEQGTRDSLSSTAHGNYSGYVGFYNFLNIKATGSNIIANALSYAQSEGWDDPEKSIIAGAKFIASEYINRGQSTLYLQKFDVDNSDGGKYYHQYMQNVSAALTEGNTVRSSYESMELLDSPINFIIPVYNNMPKEVSPSPDGVSIVTENVKVTRKKASVRDGKGTDCKEIAKLNTGDKLLRIEISGTKENGFYWDKVVLANGVKGYIVRDDIEKVDDITNANISAVANVNVNLRNGPGINGTNVIMTLTAGQSVTIIEKDKYKSVDGYNWQRIKLNNGTQGYLVSEYLTEVTKTNYIIAYVNCNKDGKVNIRNGVGTKNSVVTSLKKDTKVTVLQKNAGKSDGYSWDKIVTAEGLQGYIANDYLKYEESTPQKPAENNTNNTNTSFKNNNFKVEEKYLVSEPNTTAADIKNKYKKAVIISNNKEVSDNKLIGTGDIIKIDSKEYVVIKKGDINGDGEIKSTDYMQIKNSIMGISTLNEIQAKAADVNGDGKIKATDYMQIKNKIMGVSKIEIK